MCTHTCNPSPTAPAHPESPTRYVFMSQNLTPTSQAFNPKQERHKACRSVRHLCYRMRQQGRTHRRESCTSFPTAEYSQIPRPHVATTAHVSEVRLLIYLRPHIGHSSAHPSHTTHACLPHRVILEVWTLVSGYLSAHALYNTSHATHAAEAPRHPSTSRHSCMYVSVCA